MSTQQAEQHPHPSPSRGMHATVLSKTGMLDGSFSTPVTTLTGRLACQRRQMSSSWYSSYEHDLGHIHNDSSLSSFIDAVAAKARAQLRRELPLAPQQLAPSVTFTYSNIAYSTGFDNWIYCATTALTTPVVGAMDRQTQVAFARRNVSTIFLFDSQSVELARRSLYIKAEFVHRLLGAGLKVIFSEMDIFWVNDPHLIEDRSLDIQVSEQGYGKDDLNLGFFLAQPTRAARTLFRRLARWPHHPHYVHCWDQALFDYAVRGDVALPNLYEVSAVASAGGPPPPRP